MPIRKHQGIVQTGGKKGKLKKGYKYSGKKLKSGLSQIVKVKKSKNKKSKKGGKALAKGSSGCIFFPVVKECNPNKDYTGKVSKLVLLAATDGTAELDMGLLLNSYDREFEHFLGVTEMCKVNTSNKYKKNEITDADRKKCPELKIDNKLHDNLIMPSAIIGLDAVFQLKSIVKFGISADMIGKIIMKTCESCKILKDNGIAHFDLKNQNMMFKWIDKSEKIHQKEKQISKEEKGADIAEMEEMESFLIDFGKEFMPASWEEFFNYFLKIFDPMTYIWAPEIWLNFPKFNKSSKLKKQLRKVGDIDSWFPIYVMNLQKSGTSGWKEFIDKAMVYQMINGIFYWLSSPNFANKDPWNFIPHLDNPIKFNDKIEKIFVNNKGLRDLFIEMLTFNPNNRPTLQQVQDKLDDLGFSKTNWKFKPNDKANW